MSNQPSSPSAPLLNSIRELLTQSRKQVIQVVNTAMIQTYWQIGRLIIEDEQQGQDRAEYGKQALQALSRSLTEEFGKGFDIRNLRNMRRFYLAFPIRNAVRTELTWTHYRTLIRVTNKQARQWYMEEWNCRVRKSYVCCWKKSKSSFLRNKDGIMSNPIPNFR